MNRTYPGTFESDTVVKLSTGHRILGVRAEPPYKDSTITHTGWISGGLYLSRDGGKTWAASDLMFSMA